MGDGRGARDEQSAAARLRMVEHDLRARGVADPRVLDAMADVAREEFVPESERAHAYEDRALPIGHGQTISQPLIVAIMLEALTLRASDRMLEVGVGSGYAAAVASRLCAEVVGVERLPELAAEAAARLARLGYDHVKVTAGDGSIGLPGAGLFDAVLVSAGAPAVPPALVDQRADGGRLVIPVGRWQSSQHLLRLRKDTDGLREEDLGPVAFVPLIGGGGWAG